MEEEKNIPLNSPSYFSENIMELAAALSEFQGSLTQPKLDKEVKVKTKAGPEYKFKYADLAACMKAAAPVLKQTGLSVVQLVCNGKLITMLLHKSGQWIKSVVLLPQQTGDYQAFGSALTYLKRYTYCAILGIVADADDDANYAQGNQATVNDIKKAQPQFNEKEVLKQALDEVSKITTREMFTKTWSKWNNQYPGLCVNGSTFWKAMEEKSKEIGK